ncbi:olfactory receptor 5B17-like [Carlito syrichta]|uniref:Olfactory receptor 5B17-like n=1 Tax=Carlito syrichta TaxID=1868482 RepID=A0A1U7UGB5_CARSF|nr:olfactory receptor 5B17-like [Carlito syrichta]
MKNNTKVSEFILLGLTSVTELQFPLVIMFTLIYLITAIGNMRMITLILLDSHLHTPMYFFLSNLSLVDFGYSSTVTPKVLVGLLSEDKVISYNACAAQMFFFAMFATVESYLLASMAYDHYAAVCKPLHYTITMTKSMCTHLALGSYAIGFLNASIQIGETFCFSFYKSNVIHHFFCDIPAVMTMTCSDRHTSELTLGLISSFDVFFAILIIMTSYMSVFTTVLKMHTGKGNRKPLSTCDSHLNAMSLFYGTAIMYLQPSSSHSMDTDKIASVFYTMVIPMLNPVVYCMRNKVVESAFKKVAEKANVLYV